MGKYPSSTLGQLIKNPRLPHAVILTPNLFPYSHACDPHLSKYPKKTHRQKKKKKKKKKKKAQKKKKNNKNTGKYPHSALGQLIKNPRLINAVILTPQTPRESPALT
jgi:hypothetical protein